jgi:hypothetical protein
MTTNTQYTTQGERYIAHLDKVNMLEFHALKDPDDLSYTGLAMTVGTERGDLTKVNLSKEFVKDLVELAIKTDDGRAINE